MFRFRCKFLADSYLLLFSFFLGMIGAALFFWWRYPVFPSYLFYSYGITGNKKTYGSVSDRHKTAFFPAGVQGGSAGLRFTVYGCLGQKPVSGLSAWEWELFILHWKRTLWSLCFCVPFFLRGYFISMVETLSRWSFSTRKRLRLPALQENQLYCGAGVI